MSALPPIVTKKADIIRRAQDLRSGSDNGDLRCPLYPRKRTFAVHSPMSAAKILVLRQQIIVLRRGRPGAVIVQNQDRPAGACG
jgi:hypothetical protein